MSTLKNESYWKDPDGTVNEAGNNLAHDFNKTSASVRQLNEDGFCTNCYDPKNKITRKLHKMAEGANTAADIVLCEVCDGDAFDIACSQT